MHQLNYIAIYHICGIGVSDTSQHFQVWTDGASNAYLTKDISPFVNHVDQGTAILHGLVTASFNGTEDDARNRISVRMEEIQQERAKKYPSGTFLVFHGVKDAPELNLENCHVRPDFNLVFDKLEKSEIRAEFWPSIARSLMAITLSLKESADPRISNVTEGTYLLDPASEKPTYSFTFTAGSARLSIGTMLDEDVESRIHHYAKQLRDDRHIGKVLDQLILSLANQKDEFRSFLAAWTALEIFVTSTFKRTYEQCWFDRMRSAAPSSAESYFNNVQGVMRQRHRLLDKFIIMASLLDPDSAGDDINQFKDLKKTRDDVFHGSDDVSAYPTDQTHGLLTKYLRLHFDGDWSAGSSDNTSSES